jgi:hypothetical protein
MRYLRAGGVALALVLILPSTALAAIRITKIAYDPPGPDYRTKRQLRRAYVVIHNTSGKGRQLRGWVLRDRAGHRFTFPSYRIVPSGYVKVHTGRGRDTAPWETWRKPSTTRWTSGICWRIRPSSAYCGFILRTYTARTGDAIKSDAEDRGMSNASTEESQRDQLDSQHRSLVELSRTLRRPVDERHHRIRAAHTPVGPFAPK